jgi:hypothetical protein
LSSLCRASRQVVRKVCYLLIVFIRAFCLHFFSPSWFLTKNYVNRRRTRPCPVGEASMGRRRSVRSTWRGRSRTCIQACKDALLRRSDQYRSSKLGTARHESRAVQVLWNMRRMPVPGTGPSKYPGGALSRSPFMHRCYLTRCNSISNAKWL